jgi:hypothetical protein
MKSGETKMTNFKDCLAFLAQVIGFVVVVLAIFILPEMLEPTPHSQPTRILPHREQTASHPTTGLTSVN